MIAQMDRGTVEGTGSAINVSIGFMPDYVEVMNIDATNEVILKWTADMDDGHAMKLVGGTSGPAAITSNGITPYEGDADNAPGFTIGTDGVNANGETIVYVAIRSGLGDQTNHYSA